MQYDEVRIDLGDRSYPVLVGPGIRGRIGEILAQRGVHRNVVVITDRNVARLHGAAFRKGLRGGGYEVLELVIPPGESQKTLRTAMRMYTAMIKGGTGRGSTVIAFGGGVVGDLAGFVAATYQRGVSLVQVPTTLLAQVDSSIGGKTGVNHPLGKNMIGAFHQPVIVLADPELLRTLPPREVLCGLGEIVKYGIILDESLFSFLERSWRGILALDPPAIRYVVGRCAELKAGLVSRDEKEASERVILNCGHTIGHALEAWGKYTRFRHGEAVLMGLAAESRIACDLGLLSPGAADRILELIRQLPLGRLRLPARAEDILAWIGRDKKARNRKNRFVLPSRIGAATVREDVPVSLIRDAMRSIKAMKFGA